MNYSKKTKEKSLSKEAKKFPNSPGVYFFRDKDKKPIYIGRAGSLKKRIASYFRTDDLRIKEMVSMAVNLDFEKSNTLLEAVILEANLIKKYWPKYNVKDKDNRSFVYLVIIPGIYPKLVIVRGRELEKYSASNIKIFGPFQSYRILRVVLDIIRKIIPFSTCAAAGKKELPKIKKPCFHYQIGLCPGACLGELGKKEYQKNIKNLILFFEGKKKRLLINLKKQNPEKVKELNHVSDTAFLSMSKIVSYSDALTNGRIEGYDISHLSGKDPVGAMVVFDGGEKDVAEYRLFKIRGEKNERNYDDLKMLEEILTRRLKHKEWRYPDILFVDGGLNQVRLAKRVLSKNNLFIPIIGLSKGGNHSASAYSTDKLVIVNVKKSNKDLLIASKKLFQQVRDEVHRFAIGFNRKRRRGL